MLLKEYTKNNKYNFVLALKKNEFNFFLNKFYGSLISRGRKSFAIKQFNEILINFKENFKSDPFVELHKAINNLIPILSSTRKKIGKVYHAIPSLALGKRRFVIIINWILKKQKNKTNIRGININDVSKHLIDSVDKKGLLFKLKRQHLAYSLSGKHLLYMNRRRSYINLKRYKRSSFKSLANRKLMLKKKKRNILLKYGKLLKQRNRWKRRL